MAYLGGLSIFQKIFETPMKSLRMQIFEKFWFFWYFNNFCWCKNFNIYRKLRHGENVFSKVSKISQTGTCHFQLYLKLFANFSMSLSFPDSSWIDDFGVLIGSNWTTILGTLPLGGDWHQGCKNTAVIGLPFLHQFFIPNFFQFFQINLFLNFKIWFKKNWCKKEQKFWCKKKIGVKKPKILV